MKKTQVSLPKVHGSHANARSGENCCRGVAGQDWIDWINWIDWIDWMDWMDWIIPIRPFIPIRPIRMIKVIRPIRPDRHIRPNELNGPIRPIILIRPDSRVTEFFLCHQDIIFPKIWPCVPYFLILWLNGFFVFIEKKGVVYLSILDYSWPQRQT